jgi:hypothetical protein
MRDLCKTQVAQPQDNIEGSILEQYEHDQASRSREDPVSIQLPCSGAHVSHVWCGMIAVCATLACLSLEIDIDHLSERYLTAYGQADSAKTTGNTNHPVGAQAKVSRFSWLGQP